MTIQAVVAAIQARLESQSPPWPVEVFDGPPDDDAQTPYICIWDQTGAATRRKYAAAVDGMFFPFQLSCVARTREGLRQLVGVARTVLMWSPVAGATPIVEVGSNPILTEGVGNDQRLTAPLTMHCYLPKET